MEDDSNMGTHGMVTIADCMATDVSSISDMSSTIAAGTADDHEIMNQAFMNEEQHHQPSQESDTTTGGSQPNTSNGGNTMAATAPATVVSSSTKYKKMPEACSDPIFIEFVNDHAW